MKPFLRRKKVIYSDYLSFNYAIYIYIYIFIDANNSLSVYKMEIMKLKQSLEEKQHRNK